MEYRKKPLEFHSNFDKDDVMNAEEVIMNSQKVDKETAQSLLAEICETMFGINPYEDYE